MKTTEITLERKPPKHLEHFCAINDLRFAAELTAGLEFFFSHWELAGLGIGASWPIVPDAILGISNRRFRGRNRPGR
jgi:hypothetical protein